MQVHILTFRGRNERASLSASKMCDAAKEMNGEDDPFGSYNVISMELEDAVPTSAMHSDGEDRCVRCGDNFDDHCKINHLCAGYKARSR